MQLKNLGLDTNFYKGLHAFFKELNIPLNPLAEEPASPADILTKTYKENDPAHALMNDVFIVGMVDDAAFAGKKSKALEEINSDYDGILIFGVTLGKRDKSLLPTRSQLAEITRAFNREYPYTPVVIIFKYDKYITFANADRCKYKQEWREGEKIGKISLLKDINILKPHAGHQKILDDLRIESDVSTFNALYQQWRKVFDVQLLNKDFYRDLSAWYFWAVKEVEFPANEKTDRKIRNSMNVIRLITRLIFIWFLKEKEAGLIDEIIFDEDALKNIIKSTDKNNSSYYKAILQNLFFATLNTEMNKDVPKSRKFRSEKTFQGRNEDYKFQARYRYRKLFKNPESDVIKLFDNIPFLNGGLFDCLDNKEKKVRIDGFSDRVDNPLKVPDFLFFGKERKIDLSDDYGDKKKKETNVKGIIRILNSYKFTIAENTPIEEEIALDPELLGRVFENLLASYNPETLTTARKQTGSFYTPREIVNYMVDESLIAYLSNEFIQNTSEIEEKDLDKNLHLLLEYSNDQPFKRKKERELIIRAIDKIKILDPACGSGAFPMGALHKMVYILSKIDPENNYWRELQKQKAIKETEDAYQIGDKTDRQQRLIEIDDAFENNASDYGRKLYLIENCIYGVDIQSIAAQISKLRFFISLIVDQKINKQIKNLGVTPLPNLETKFVAANTLIGLDKPQIAFESNEIIELKKKLALVRHNHFKARTPKQKNKWRTKDESLRAKIAEQLERDGWGSISAKQLADWDPYDQNASANFFDSNWMFGTKEGFDIVIGNPPYIKEYTHRSAFNGVRNSPYYQGKMDIWYLFACQGLDISKTNSGILAFIATNNWVTNYGASKMRNKIIKGAKIEKLLDFGSYMIFESSDIQTMVMIFRNQGNIGNYKFDYRKLSGSPITFNDVLDLISFRKNPKAEYITPTIKKETFTNKTFTFSSNKIEDVLNKIVSKANFFLHGNKEVANGIHPHHASVTKPMLKHLNNNFSVGDGIFLLNDQEKRSMNLSKKEFALLKPSYTSKELHKYHGNLKNFFWIIYTDSSFKREININPYPNIKKHLDKFRKVITSDNKPYGLHRSRVETFFKGEKIMALRKCAAPVFTYTEYDCYVLAEYYVIKTNRINLKHLTGLLNSKLIEFWLKHKGKMQGSNYQIDKEPILSIPIIKSDSPETLKQLVDQILTAKENDPHADTTALEKQIDIMVYKLYGLTYEDVKIIDPEFEMTEIEYNKFSIEG